MAHSILPVDDPNPLLENPEYEKIQTLGRGAFGFVMLAKNARTQELVAIKCLKRSDVNKYVEAEIVNHSLLRHPHVIQFKDVFLTTQHICIVMEYAMGGTLFQYVQQHGRLKEAVARWFFQQLVLGVDYCHHRGVANRDIKLENTLLQVVTRLPLPLVKICDFGYSKADFKSAAKSKVGTLTYMAPEVLIPWKDHKYDGKVADIWSCGVMLYVMLCGRYPFESPPSGASSTSHEIISMLEKMIAQDYTIPDSLGISAECRELLQRMLLPKPASRITLEEILAHSWFNTNLPPEAATMNATYLRSLPNPRFIDRVKHVIEDARGNSQSSSHPRGQAADGTAPMDEDSIERIINTAISEQIQSGEKTSEVVHYAQSMGGSRGSG